MRNITEKNLSGFQMALISEEKSNATVEKYMRNVQSFCLWLSGKNLDKSAVLAYKAELTERTFD